MDYKFTLKETLLGLSTIIAWADGENQSSQIDSRVTLILKEGISNDEFNAFKKKYDEINSLEFVYQESIKSLKQLDEPSQAKAIAWMWEVANVATSEDEMVDLGQLEQVEEWIKDKKYVQLDELKWINRAKKDLGLSVEAINNAFAALPAAKRI